MADAQKNELDEQQEEAGDGEEESGVAEVGDADRRLGGWGAFGVGGRKTGTVTAGSSEEKGRTEEEDVLGVRSLMLFRAG
jgi:hypothetical protein